MIPLFAPATSLYLLSLLLSALLLAGCDRPSAGNMEASEATSRQLSRLTLEDVSKLGPHRADSNLILTTGGSERAQKVTEDYELHWDNAGRFRYVVRKGAVQTMDVTVWEGKAYQRQPEGRVRIRPSPDEFHYYLRQTWNQWNAAIEPFKQVLLYELEQATQIEGRPVDKYRISLKPQIDPKPTGKNRLRQAVEHDKVEGALWLDRATLVPLQIEFHGEYRLVRFSRGPGSPGEEARYVIDFKTRRYQIGQQQVTGPPDTVARP